VLGAVLLVYAIVRRRVVEGAIVRGGYAHPDELIMVGVLGGGAVLGITTAIAVVI